MRLALVVAACLAAAIPAAAQMGERPSVNSGMHGRWWLVIRADDGRLPELGPLPSREACLAAQDSVVADMRARSGDRVAARTRERSFCERR